MKVVMLKRSCFQRIAPLLFCIPLFAAACGAIAADTNGASSANGAWALGDAPWRCTFLAKRAPSAPEAGWEVEVPELGQTLPAAADVVLLDSLNKPLPVERVFRLEGQKVTLIAQGLQSGQSYTVYFGGGRTRATPVWNAKSGLFMEVRRLPEGNARALVSADALESAFRNSTEIEGGAFVSSILLGGNPFGDSRDYVARFRGWLKPGAMSAVLQTVSSDASFVWLNRKLEVSHPGEHRVGAQLRAGDIGEKSVVIPPEGVLVEYLVGKVGPGGSARLCYKTGNKAGIFENNDWLQTGTTERVRLEHIKLGEVPRLVVTHRDYLGWEGLWLFDSSIAFEKPVAADWALQWEFSDGSRPEKATAERVLSGLKPLMAFANFSRGPERVRAAFRISTAGDIKAATTQARSDVNRYLGKMENEDLAHLAPETLKGFFRFAREFGTDEQIGRLSAAWINGGASTTDPNWIIGLVARLRAQAQKDPNAALSELGRLPTAVAKQFLSELAVVELDIRVFLLKDNSALKLAQQLLREPGLAQNAAFVQAVRTRIGDLFRMQGKLKEATEAYLAVQTTVVDDSGGRKFAVQDRAHSVSIAELIEEGHRDEAEARLRVWELAHPMAKLQSDFLLLRAQSLMLFGRWGEALQEIESFKALNPDSPFQIPADFHMGRALAGLGRKDEARKIWSSIVTQFPKHPLAVEARRLGFIP
jgi:tetratricopeptide (TPR) repeat protein